MSPPIRLGVCSAALERFQPHRAGTGISAVAQRQPVATSRLLVAGGVLGFALGGFFDGILLHQVLQWHHLFSLVPGEIWRDMRMQILMDDGALLVGDTANDASMCQPAKQT